MIVPGYGADARSYAGLQQNLAAHLRALGSDAPRVIVAPIRWRDWVPTLGGRPVTPILDIISRTVDQLGARKVNLVAHSAAGWICRIWLGDREYSGARYGHAHRVSTLVTLGTPHTTAEFVAVNNLAFVNDNYPGAYHAPHVRYVCVAGDAVRLRRPRGALEWAQLAMRSRQLLWAGLSYRLTEGGVGVGTGAGAAAMTVGDELERVTAAAGHDGSGDGGGGVVHAERVDRADAAATVADAVWEGDGIVPVKCAHLPGAENILLPVWHSPSSGGAWYGDADVVPLWVPYLR